MGRKEVEIITKKEESKKLKVVSISNGLLGIKFVSF